MKNWASLLFIVLAGSTALGQSTCSKLQFCSHSSSNLTVDKVRQLINTPARGGVGLPPNYYSSVRSAQTIVDRILCLGNAPDTHIEVRGDDCPNATAVLCADRKYILFNIDYIERVLSSADSNVIYGVFAHEVGHLIRGDAWLGGDRKHESELNADRFAGHILGLLDLREKLVQSTLSQVDTVGSVSHPPRSDREKIMLAGWQSGLQNRKKLNPKILEYMMQCKKNPLSPFSIAIDQKPSRRKDYYDVSCRITGDSAALKTIKSVTYYLHPYSFENNHVTFLDPRDTLTMQLWGSFELRASVLCERNDTQLEYLLGQQITIVDKFGNKRTKLGQLKEAYIEDTPYHGREKSITNVVKKTGSTSRR